MSAVLDEVELAWSTPRAWAVAALRDPLALVSDHAHCELRAASTGQALILARIGNEDFEGLPGHSGFSQRRAWNRSGSPEV